MGDLIDIGSMSARSAQKLLKEQARQIEELKKELQEKKNECDMLIAGEMAINTRLKKLEKDLQMSIDVDNEYTKMVEAHSEELFKVVERLAKAVKRAHQEGWWDAAADHLKADVSLARKVYEGDWKDSQALAALNECAKSFE